MFKNLSEAINIQAPYNFERILYWTSGKLTTCYFVDYFTVYSGNDSNVVLEMYTKFEESGKMTITGDLLSKLQMNILG